MPLVAELLRFPDVEAALVTALNAGLLTHEPTVKASTKPPKGSKSPRGDEYITVISLGGASETFVTSTPLVTVEAYAKSEPRAYELCDLALAIIRSQDGTIRGARGFAYPQNLPDPTTSQVRYTSTGEVRVWGAVSP